MKQQHTVQYCHLYNSVYQYYSLFPRRRMCVWVCVIVCSYFTCFILSNMFSMYNYFVFIPGVECVGWWSIRRFLSAMLTKITKQANNAYYPMESIYMFTLQGIGKA